MLRTRLLLYAFALALFVLLPFVALAHPATGLVVDAQAVHVAGLRGFARRTGHA